MSVTLPILSEDQAEAWDRLSHQLQGMGVDLTAGTITPQADGKSSVLAVVGKAGSGKTMLLASLYKESSYADKSSREGTKVEPALDPDADGLSPSIGRSPAWDTPCTQQEQDIELEV